MPLTDLTLPELLAFRPEVAEPDDFDAFWADTIDEARAAAETAGTRPSLTPAATPVTQLIIEDLTFPGFGGEPVRAWVSRPRDAEGPLPAVVQYQGYNGGRGLPGENVLWALAGYVHVFMDTRGQGSGWGTGGVTADPHGSGPATAGFMTRGIHDPREHFYRRVFTDAVRAVDATRTLPFVDADRIAVTGGSQGGGIALAAGALAGVQAVLPDVAFLCAYRRGAEVAADGPFQELAMYLSVHRDEVDTVFRTLSYLDGVNFARRIEAPSLFSVALMDTVVPPSTTFAAYNHLAAADRAIEVYAFNDHEGGQTAHWQKQAEWLAARI
ncbi:acetyl xylan esterase [Leifsonia sp. Leaf336]|uniref:acetylxylan esterase n=1 Tax=Leifsonia sp. Leaf336 TaxID=1736341 RepID=UPI0006FAB427|nr:acetylxylan esterase [Leifsonia sp. Leaf336]KQR52017.1 acetyl xylan esterase [Leifsonia sp. Leaf336]